MTEQQAIHATVNTNPVQQRMQELDAWKQGQEESNPFVVQHGYAVDTATGEALPALREELNQEIDIILPHQETPEYLVEWEKLDLPDQEKASLLSVYDTPVNLKSFKQYRGKDVDIYGAIIWYHPPFISNGKGMDKDGNIVPVGQRAEGYHQIRFLTFENGEVVTIAASYGALALHVHSILNMLGWFIWKEPITYRFEQNPDSNAFQMVNQDRVKLMLAGMKKGGKK